MTWIVAGGFDPVREAVRLFNETHFFEAHEVLEDVWRKERGDSRLFLQGLIQLCAAFHHFQNRNFRGAAELLERGRAKVRRYPDGYLGLDTRGLLADVDSFLVKAEGLRDGREAPDPVAFPILHLRA